MVVRLKFTHSLRLRFRLTHTNLLLLVLLCLPCLLHVLISPVSSTSNTGVPLGSFVEMGDINLQIRAGSPLDFSSFLDVGPAGVNGRVTIGPSGRFAYTNKPDVPVKFFCASLAWAASSGGMPNRVMADLYAAQLKRHGYNLVRFHYLEAHFLTFQPAGNYNWNTYELDNWYYFIAALRREGIYYNIDGMSSENGGHVVSPGGQWALQWNGKMALYYNKSARQDWRDLIDHLYVPVNPYTNTSILEDTGLLGIVLVNEDPLVYIATTRGSGVWPQELQPAWANYVRAKYDTDAALHAAWPGTWSAAQGVAAGETLRNLTTILLPSTVSTLGPPRLNDFMRFCSDLEVNLTAWQTMFIRSRGFVGPITSLDNWAANYLDRSRSTLDWIDMHSYDEEILTYTPGTVAQQSSSLDNHAQFIRYIAAARHAGKPLTSTEWGKVFWSKYRFEGGAVAYSMAAFQQFDFICQHATGGIDLNVYQTASHKTAIIPYNVGLDPITRAGETLGAFLYARGDVSPAIHRILVDFTSPLNDVSLTAPNDWLPPGIINLAWITGIEQVWPGETSTWPADKTYRLYTNETGGEVIARYSNGTIGFSTYQNKNMTYLYTEAIYDEMLRCQPTAGQLANRCQGSNKWFSPDDPTDGYFIMQSETGELYLDSRLLQFHIRTSRTESFSSALPVSRPGIKLISLQVNWISIPLQVSASSIDPVDSLTKLGPSLANSHKILLIMATDAENTGMTFMDGPINRTTINNIGTTPVRLQRGTASLTLTMNHSLEMQVIALTLNGEPVTGGRGRVRLLRRDLDGGIGTSWTFTLDSTNPVPTTYWLMSTV